MFPLLCCKGAETASDSLSVKPASQLSEKNASSVCVSMSVDVEEVGTVHGDFRFYGENTL